MSEQLEEGGSYISTNPITLKIWPVTDRRPDLVETLWNVVTEHGGQWRIKDKGVLGKEVYESEGYETFKAMIVRKAER